MVLNLDEAKKNEIRISNQEENISFSQSDDDEDIQSHLIIDNCNSIYQS